MIDLLIGGIATYTLAALAGGWNALTKESSKQKREKERLALWKADMTDIDPITGDYTSKYDGRRYDKHGIPLSRKEAYERSQEGWRKFYEEHPEIKKPKGFK